MIERLPPSIAALLGAVIFTGVGLSIGGIGMYAYTKERVKADTARAELTTVISGEEAAKGIRIDKDEAIAASAKLVKKVESGEEKILSADGNSITPNFTIELQRKIIKARTISD